MKLLKNLRLPQKLQQEFIEHLNHNNIHYTTKYGCNSRLNWTRLVCHILLTWVLSVTSSDPCSQLQVYLITLILYILVMWFCYSIIRYNISTLDSLFKFLFPLSGCLFLRYYNYWLFFVTQTISEVLLTQRGLGRKTRINDLRTITLF